MIYWLFILPLALGMLMTKFIKKEWQSIPMIFVSGYLSLFASFQFVYLWFVAFYNKFEILSLVYAVLITAAAILGVVFSSKYWLKMLREGWKNKAKIYSKGELLLWGIFVLLLGFQLYKLCAYQFLDSDDAYYAAISVITNENLTMYKNIPYTGESTGLDVRHAFSSAPIFLSFVARMCDMHPTIITHSVYPIIILLLLYFIYAVIAKRILREHKEYVPLFLIFIGLFYMFGNSSIYTDATFLLTRTSQGKAFLANIVPAALVMNLLLIWDTAFQKESEGERYISWLLLSITMITAVYASTMGVFMGPFIAGGGVLLMIFSAKKIKAFLPVIISMVPMGIMGILILLLH